MTCRDLEPIVGTSRPRVVLRGWARAVLRATLLTATLLPTTLTPLPANSAPPRGTVVVELTGFGSDAGWAMLALHDKPDAFPTKPKQAFRLARSAVKGKRARFEWKDVPHGRYAVSAFHDENANGELDTNWLGIPKERLGASNGAKGKGGPPRFADAAFQLAGASVTQNIVLEHVL